MSAPTKPPIALATDCRCGHAHHWHIGEGMCVDNSRCPCKRYQRRTEAQR